MQYVVEVLVCRESCGGYSVISSNVEGMIAQGESLFEALTRAENAFGEIMVAYENFQAGRSKEMTNKIAVDKIAVNASENRDGKNFTTLIKVDTDVYRENPSDEIELWYSPKTKKYFTVLTDDDEEVKPIAEKRTREVSGVK